MSKILFDGRWIGEHGIGRFAREIYGAVDNLEEIKLDGDPASKYDSFRLTKYLSNNKGCFFSPGYNSPLKFLERCIITVHDLNHIDVISNTTLLKKIYYNTILKNACKKSAKIFTVSEFSKERICEWSHVDSGQVIVVGNGVSPSFNFNVDNYAAVRPYILTVGNRRRHKNELMALQAYARSSLSKTHDYLFTGETTNELMQEINNYGIDGNVIFTGKVSDDVLATIYKGASLLFFPSLYEGFGLPVIEAMACGTPVITSNGTSLKEVAGEAALLVDPCNIDEMVYSLEKVVNSESVAESLKLKGLEQAKKFTWEKTTNKINQELKKLIG
ncbi:Mannosylfructose-phosphate synthase [Serratia quinivorans]|uniref:glycosyltransferase family 4 protein n=1 Tax=Serratia quinivorans TaxID=137545 RepID=UPI00217AE0A5|nr:glycosyltransferase family 1 protein [Serratia quinivorans]CAI1545850.1 Mannosylfructose-phosphate synthase [Serratia quinivorans]